MCNNELRQYNDNLLNVRYDRITKLRFQFWILVYITRRCISVFTLCIVPLTMKLWRRAKNCIICRRHVGATFEVDMLGPRLRSKHVIYLLFSLIFLKMSFHFCEKRNKGQHDGVYVAVTVTVLICSHNHNQLGTRGFETCFVRWIWAILSTNKSCGGISVPI